MPYTSRINTPSNQVRLTNVAVVRMNKGGKRFEIACYRNKVVDYRQGLENDLGEVLQTERIFANVSKGEFAKAKDMRKIFGTADEDEISKLILAKGQLQVSDKERTQQLEKTSAQIAEWISKNCVHPKSDRPYTISQIRHAMQQANVSIHPTKKLKPQYLDCVKLLQKIIPIERAKMELLLLISPVDKTEIETTLRNYLVTFSEETKLVNSDKKKKDAFLEYQVLVDPSLYRILNQAMQNMTGARIEIVNQVVTKQGDVNLDQSHIHSQDDADEDHNEKNEENNTTHRKSRIQKKENQKLNREVTHTTAKNSNKSESDDRKSCNTCGGLFDNASKFRAHFKSDWHRFNQKLKLNGSAPVTEEEFALCDSDLFFNT